MSASIIGFTLGGLVGYMLADNKAYSTIPLTMIFLGAVLTSIPASYFMQRYGRRAGFCVGALFGISSGALAIYAIYAVSFSIFCVANFLHGVYRGIAHYYRFAAIEVSTTDLQPHAISYVLAGGVVAALLGPQIAILTRDMLTPMPFAGAYLAVVALGLTALLPLSFLSISRSPGARRIGPTRSASVILRQPAFLAAAANAGGGYALMTLLMTATPLSMVGHGFSVDNAAVAIQWHVLAMFLPSFFTGHFISRFGLLPVVYIGMLFFAIAIMIAVSGLGYAHFVASTIFVGVAWNFMYVGGTALLTEAHTELEKAKTQAFNEFVVVGLTALTSLLSGVLLDKIGWVGVNVIAVPALCLISATTLWYSVRSSITSAST